MLYLLLALNFIRLPKIAVNLTHDPGSHMSFEFYARAKAQFGVDVIQNVGPYGYLQYPYDYSGILPTQKLLFGILFGMLVAWFALDARNYFFTTTGKVIWFVGLFLALVPEHEDLDPVSYLFIFLAGRYLLMSERTGPARYVAEGVLGTVLGLLCMMKSTNVMLVTLLMMLVTIERIRTGHFLELAWNLCCVGLTALVLWVHAGQKISNAMVFMHGAAEFSKGYNEALSFAGRPEMVWLGIIVMGLFAVISILRVLKFRIYWHRLPTSVFEAACIFIVWKHGYVRAGHELIFWSVLVMVAPLLFWAHERPSPEEGASAAEGVGSRRAGWWRTNVSMYRLAPAPVLITYLCVMAAGKVESTNNNFADYQNPVAAFVSPLKRAGTNFAELADWPNRLKALKAQLQKNREDAALPAVKQAIDNATIDEFGFLPGTILLNDFHYTPRPMPINFGATTQMLMERNAEFYRNPATAPAFLLCNIGQIDGRLAPQDDALALLEVLQHYQPLLADHGFLLLKRIPAAPDLERTFLSSQTVNWGEIIPVPPRGTNLLWCSADIKFSLSGRVRAFLFQPPQLFLLFETPSREMGPVRVLQSGASTGFLLRPLIINGVDFLATYGIHAQPSSSLTPSFDGMRFVTAPEDRAFFEPKITVSFWSVGPKNE